MNSENKKFGIVILLDVLGAAQRIQKDVDTFLNDWNLVLNRLEENKRTLEQLLSKGGYTTGIRIKDIFDNIQIFIPTDDPTTKHRDYTGGISIWWSIQHSADLLINLLRYAITKNIFLRGCISMGHIQEFREAYYGKPVIENAQFAESLDMIGVIAAPSSTIVLRNKSYSSSPRFYYFIQYHMPINNPTRKRRKFFDKLAILNLTRKSDTFDNVDDKEVENKIQEQLQGHQNSVSIRRKWENTKTFMEYVSKVTDEKLFL